MLKNPNIRTKSEFLEALLVLYAGGSNEAGSS